MGLVIGRRMEDHGKTKEQLVTGTDGATPRQRLSGETEGRCCLRAKKIIAG